MCLPIDGVVHLVIQDQAFALPGFCFVILESKKHVPEFSKEAAFGPEFWDAAPEFVN